MAGSEDRREEIIRQLADYVLAKGLGASSLRPLAAAAGTSDRMLLYYFTDKSALIAAVLEHITARLGEALEASAQQDPGQPVLADIWRRVCQDDLRDYMRLWLDIAARAARGEDPYPAVGARIVQGFLGWIEARSTIADAGRRRVHSAAVLTAIEGMLVLDAVGQREVAEAMLEALTTGM